MKKSIVLKAYLIVSGLLLTLIGGGTLANPVALKQGSGIDMAGNINLLNDTRATGALLLALALLTLWGAFVKKLTYTSSFVAPLLFLSLGLGRLISIGVDGMPIDAVVKATGLEFVLGLAGVLVFNRFKVNA